MAINQQAPDIRELRPHITVFGVGGAGGNAVNNMIESGLEGVEFVVSNTDAQALASSKAQRVVQMGIQVTEGLGAGSQPEVGRAAACGPRARYTDCRRRHEAVPVRRRATHASGGSWHQRAAAGR